MKTLGVSLNISKIENVVNKIVGKTYNIVNSIIKKVYEKTIMAVLNKTLKNVYVIVIKCDNKVKETAILCGNEKDAISKLIKMNNQIDCQGNKSFEIIKITPDDIKEMVQNQKK